MTADELEPSDEGVPPGGLAAEMAQAVERDALGALLRGAPAGEIQALMPAHRWSTGYHQLVAEVIYGLAGAGAPVSPTSVAQAMHERGLLGRFDLGKLAELHHDAPMPAQGLYFAEKARRYAALRVLHQLGEQLREMALSDIDDAPAVLREAARRAVELADAIEPPMHQHKIERQAA